DVTIMTAKYTPDSLYFPGLGLMQQWIHYNPYVYISAEQRMEERLMLTKQAWHTFENASGPKRVETLTEFGVSVFGPSWFIKGIQALSQIHEFGVLNPPKFHPIWLDELRILLKPIRHLSPNDI